MKKLHSHLCKLIRLPLFLGLLICLPLTGMADQGLLGQVKVAPRSMDLSLEEGAVISWSQGAEAGVDLFICDLSGRIVRTLHKKEKLEAGGQQVSWDGLDDQGESCVNGVYLPIIRAKFKKAGVKVYNPTTADWGEEVTTEATYNPVNKTVDYQLSKSALCLLRIGESGGGPLYRTLFGWQPRKAGQHSEPWDGWDSLGVVNVAQKKKMYLVVEAFSLPENAILLKGGGGSISSKTKAKRFPLRPPRGKDLFLHALHPRERCKDLEIHASMAEARGRSAGEAVVLSKETVIEVSTSHSAEEKRRLERERLELYVYVDGRMETEESRQKLPTSIQFDPRKYESGEHVLTMILKTREDHAGTYSMKIFIEKD